MDKVKSPLIIALVSAIVLTILSYFMGGVRYPYSDEVTILPIWIQLLRNFLIYFVVVFLGSTLTNRLPFLSKKKK